MSTRKSYKIISFIFIMIMINFWGKIIAHAYSLPVWMDSVGTVFAAYVCDPFCGAVVGLAGNLMYGIWEPVSIFYGITNIIIGISVGYCARKKMFESLFGTLSASVLVTLFSVAISTPINLFTNNGMTGNVWGDGVVSYLLENDVSQIPASLIGEFYMDFLDKVTAMIILYLTIKLVRFRRRKMNALLLTSFIVLTFGMITVSDNVNAETGNIYNNNIQMVYSRLYRPMMVYCG